ncbi:MAG: SDR family NAD(P)-dependent oxidoreductase [Candidatus Halalkalibacterium sp. M3_1C_030]
MSFQTSSVIITGASRGIGRSIARVFSERTDHPLVLIARSEEGLEETVLLCKEAGASGVVAIPCDLTQESEVINISLPESFPSPGVLINNAGSYLYKTLESTDSSEFMEQIRTNLFSAVYVTNRFMNDLKSRERGMIINICSVGALEGLEESGAYASSKHALLGYTRSLRKELMQSNIAVTAINLGQTKSTSWESSDVNPLLLIDPEDIGKLLVSLSEFSPRTVAEEIIMKPQHGRVPPM